MTPEEFKYTFDVGVMMEKLNSIEGKLDDMKDGMRRGAERMGRLEEAQIACDRTTAVLVESFKGLDRSVDKLERSKTWFITAIIGAFLAQITQWFMGHKG